MAKQQPWHVYAEDGFEGAFTTEKSAIAAAKRGSKLRGLPYRVVRVGSAGYTGAGAGTVVAQFYKGHAEEVDD